MVVADFVEGAFQARADQARHARVGLDHQEHTVALRLEVSQRLREGAAPEGAEVDVIHTALEGHFDAAGGNAVARRDAQAADFAASASEDCVGPVNHHFWNPAPVRMIPSSRPSPGTEKVLSTAMVSVAVAL